MSRLTKEFDIDNCKHHILLGCDIQGAADGMGISTATLKRRLRSRGLSFGQLQKKLCDESPIVIEDNSDDFQELLDLINDRTVPPAGELPVAPSDDNLDDGEPALSEIVWKGSSRTDKMRMADMDGHLEQTGIEAGPYQFLAETVRNEIDAGCTEINLFADWAYLAETKRKFPRDPSKWTYRLVIQGNGHGMDKEGLERLNDYGYSTRGKSIHSHMGTGFKQSLAHYNPQGVWVFSWTGEEDQGHMCYFGKGENGFGQFALDSVEGGRKEQVVPIPDALVEKYEKEWGDAYPFRPKGGHGTVLILLGGHEFDDTLLGPNPVRCKELTYQLNHRFARFPGVKVRALEVPSIHKLGAPRAPDSKKGGERGYPWPSHPVRSQEEDHSQMRVVEGADSYWEKSHEAKGKMIMSDGTEIVWYLLKENRADVHAFAMSDGVIAVQYGYELYEVAKSKHDGKREPNRKGDSTARTRMIQFGVQPHPVQDRLVLTAKPPLATKNTPGIYSQNSRVGLLYGKLGGTGMEIPWSDWSVEFRANLPEPIRKACVEYSAHREASPDLFKNADRWVREQVSLLGLKTPKKPPKELTRVFLRRKIEIAKLAEYMHLKVSDNTTVCPKCRGEHRSMTFTKTRFQCSDCDTSGDCVDLACLVLSIDPGPALEYCRVFYRKTRLKKEGTPKKALGILPVVHDVSGYHAPLQIQIIDGQRQVHIYKDHDIFQKVLDHLCEWNPGPDIRARATDTITQAWWEIALGAIRMSSYLEGSSTNWGKGMCEQGRSEEALAIAGIGSLHWIIRVKQVLGGQLQRKAASKVK